MAATPNYVLLQQVTLTASASSFTFSGIPAGGYTDLKLTLSVRSDLSTNYGDGILFYYNGANSNLSSRRLYVNNGSSIGSTSGTVQFAGMACSNGQTSGNYGVAELYIPNYNTSANKSSMSDGSSINNSATLTQMQQTANLWTSSSAISSITFYPESGTNWLIGSSFSLYGIAGKGVTPSSSPKASGGDIIKTDGTYWYHAFLNSGTFQPAQNLTADVLVVAGGGGAGGYDIGGGGGAGGLLGFSSQALTASSYYNCVIGAGGPAAVKGSDSTFGLLTTAVGGGYGGNSGSSGGSGGSGGGAGKSYTVVTNAGTASPSGQGNNGGGTVYNSDGPTGGGGGATAAGGSGSGGSTGPAGAGGAGSSAYSSWGSATSTGQNVGGTYWFAGGGGGAARGGGTPGTGGNGGGVTGASGTGTPSAAVANTGGGGGGGSLISGTQYPGGAGGSGIIIVRYTVA